MKFISLAFICCFSITLLFLSCEHDIPEPELITAGDTSSIDSCDPDVVYFDQQLLPLLVSNCAFSGCHDAGTSEGGVVITTYETLMASDVVTPFDPDGSDLYESLTESDPDKLMPPPPNFDPLSTTAIDLIRKWIEQGAKDLTCIGGCDTNIISYSLAVQPIIANRCTGCHANLSLGGGILITNYSELETLAKDGRLHGVINHLKGYKAMPLGTQKCRCVKFEKLINGLLMEQRMIRTAGLIFVVMITVAVVAPGCYYDVEDELYPIAPVDSVATYAEDIRPIISSSCSVSGCHVPGTSAPGDFTTYEGLKAKVDQGSVRTRVIDRRNMPPDQALNPTELQLIEIWLNDGAPNN